MSGLSIENIEVLLCVAAIVALIARRLRLPYTVGLVVAGAGIAATGLLHGFTLTKDLVFRALLPPLIFEAAFFIQWKELRQNLVPVLTLALVGVLASTAIIAALMWGLASWNIAGSLVFGALIAATDPVSVIAMFKELKVEGRLRLLVEAESLLNDGAAAVVFGLAIVFAANGELSAGEGALLLVREVGGGVVCGAVVAGVALYLAGKTQEHLVELTLTAVSAFGAFLLAEYFHCSGVLAVLVAGLLIGNIGQIGAITDHGREAVGAFWEFAAFVSNSLIFLLIGMREFALGNALVSQLPTILLAIFASLAARALSVYGLSGLFVRSRNRIPASNQHVLFWGGLKGALSLALVLGLPESFPLKEQLIAAAFGVVAFSVLVQGISMPYLMRRLGLLSK